MILLDWKGYLIYYTAVFDYSFRPDQNHISWSDVKPDSRVEDNGSEDSVLLKDPHGFESLAGRFRFGDVDAEAPISRGSPEQQNGHHFGERMDEDGRAVLDEFEGQIGDSITTLVRTIDKSVTPLN